MNVVPLIDILLVLIIIFMVITPTIPLGLDAEAPQTQERTSVEPPVEAVVVWISRTGEVRVNQEATGWEQLGGRLEEIFKPRATRVAFVWGDPTVEFREVTRAIDVMRDAGIERVGLLPGAFGSLLSPPSRR